MGKPKSVAFGKADKMFKDIVKEWSDELGLSVVDTTRLMARQWKMGEKKSFIIKKKKKLNRNKYELDFDGGFSLFK